MSSSGAGGSEPKNVRLGKGQKKADWQVIGVNFMTVGLLRNYLEFSLSIED